MPQPRFDLAEIARSALNDMPDPARAAFLAEILIELRGPRAIDLLSKVRAAVSLRMQELIDEKFPLHELAAVYGDPKSALARISAAQPMPVGFFDPDGTKHPVSARRGRQIQKAGPNVEPFLPAAEMADLLALRRHGRVERCKEILKVIHLVIQAGVLEGADLQLNGAAERLAVLIFGEKINDRH